MGLVPGDEPDHETWPFRLQKTLHHCTQIIDALQNLDRVFIEQAAGLGETERTAVSIEQ